jgi:hypothetical protein
MNNYEPSKTALKADTTRDLETVLSDCKTVHFKKSNGTVSIEKGRWCKFCR